MSFEFITSGTETVITEVLACQARRLELMCHVIFFDVLRTKIHEYAGVRKQAICLVKSVLPYGARDILSLLIEQAEGAMFWMMMSDDLKTCGVGDIHIAVMNGLKGIPVALGTVFLVTTLQSCAGTLPDLS